MTYMGGGDYVVRARGLGGSVVLLKGPLNLYVPVSNLEKSSEKGSVPVRDYPF